MTRKLNRHTLALWAALPMARTAQVESRLQMILKPNASRRALTRRAVLVSLAAAALGVGTLAALRPAAQAQNDAAASWKQTLPNGATVEVLGVSDPLLSPAVWWKPDGTPLAAPIDPEKTVTSTAKQQRIFAVRITPPPGSTEDPGTTFDAHGMAISGFASQPLTLDGRRLPVMSIVSVRTEAGTVPAQADLRCGVAAGAWKTQAAQAEYADGKSESVTGGVFFSRLTEINGNAAITVTDNMPEVERRIVAVDGQGKMYVGLSQGGVSSGTMRQGTSDFEGLPMGKVKEVRFQTRPYQWADFKNVALQPAQH